MANVNSFNNTVLQPLKVNGISQETRVSAVSVDFTGGAGNVDTVLYTVPTGASFVVTKAILRNTLAVALDGTTSISLGTSAGGFTEISTLASLAGVGGGEYALLTPSVGGVVWGASTQTIIARTLSVAAATGTVQVDLFGYLV